MHVIDVKSKMLKRRKILSVEGLTATDQTSDTNKWRRQYSTLFNPPQQSLQDLTIMATEALYKMKQIHKEQRELLDTNSLVPGITLSFSYTSMDMYVTCLLKSLEETDQKKFKRFGRKTLPTFCYT